MGCPHPEALLERLTSTKLLEWQAYFRVLDEERWAETKAMMDIDNHRTGLIAAAIGNFSPISKKHDFVPGDFIGKKKRELTLGEKIRIGLKAPPKPTRPNKKGAR